MALFNKRWVLASRPAGEPTPHNFKLEESELPPLAEGQVLVRHHFLSLDPYMRGRMSDEKSYAQPQALGAVMIGGTVGEVIESRHAQYKPGDSVMGMGGWQQYAVMNAGEPGMLRKIDASRIPISAYLGAVGMPGVTAWVGLTKFIEPKANETIVVSAASGAVGSAVGQLAKARGCRAVGIAGGAEKCDYVVRELGFDACLDYKRLDGTVAIATALERACPNGIDGYFENVGGAVLDAVMKNANAFSRVAVCGMISGYSGVPIPMAAPQLILLNRMRLQGFIVSEHMSLWPQALAELAERVANGSLKYRESISTGLQSAPEAFIGLLKGRNFGKQLVKLI